MTLNILNEAKQKTIDYIINSMSMINDEEKDNMGKNLNSIISINDINSSCVDFHDEIATSEDINEITKKLEYDLLNAFNCSQLISREIDNYSLNSISNLYSSLTRCNILNDSIDNLNNIVNSKMDKFYYTENFRNYNSFENDKYFYTERYGELVSTKITDIYNSDEEYIEIPKLRNANMVCIGEGILTGTATVDYQVGSGLIKVQNTKNDIDNVLNSDNVSFWSESILSDEKFNIIQFHDQLSNDYMFSCNHGAVFIVTINFEAVTLINQLLLKPASKYPIRILGVRSITSDYDKEKYNTILDFSKETVYLDKVTSFNFKETICKKIFIVCVQEHYTKKNYSYNTNDILKNKLWYFNNYNSKSDVDDNMLFKPLYLDRVNVNQTWNYINFLNNRNKKIDLKNILIDSKSKIKNSNKYEYSYGFYNISPMNVDYDRIGIFVSKPILSNSNIKKISVVTQEEHQLSENHTVITDIEYYVSIYNAEIKNKKLIEWVPICPTNKNVIESELLQLYNSKCYLRFLADEVYGVYINDEKLIKNSDYFLETIEFGPNKGLIENINIPNYDHKAIYTVSYKPNDMSKEIKFDENKYTVVENINCDNSACYNLKYFPVSSLDKNRIYIRLFNEDGILIASDGTEIVNMTDMEDQYNSYKNFKDTETIQYYNHKNSVYFNKPLKKGWSLEVTYCHNVNSFRIKGIMRRNNKRSTYITPKLKNLQFTITNME